MNAYEEYFNKTYNRLRNDPECTKMQVDQLEVEDIFGTAIKYYENVIRDDFEKHKNSSLRFGYYKAITMAYAVIRNGIPKVKDEVLDFIIVKLLPDVYDESTILDGLVRYAEITKKIRKYDQLDRADRLLTEYVENCRCGFLQQEGFLNYEPWEMPSTFNRYNK